MEKLKIPLLYYQVHEQAVFGMLVGAAVQAMAPDLGQLKTQLLNFLKKEYKKNETHPVIPLGHPRLKVLKVNIRPSYRDGSSSFPLPYLLTVPIPAVYGANPRGYFECFLPLFQERFSYYHADHFEPLSIHLANSYLNDLQPEEIFRLVNTGEPELDFLEMRIKGTSSYDWTPRFGQQDFQTLNQLAEQYPYPKAVRKALSQAPDAAWEREPQVEEVVEKILATRSNLLLVGEHGAGKSAVLQQAIRKIIAKARNWKYQLTFWRIIPQRITASAKYLGEWQETCETLVDELERAQGILWVISMIRLLEIGGHGPEDSVAAFFTNFLQQGKMQLIGEATPRELESMRRMLPGFVEHFHIIHLDELPDHKILRILDQFADHVRKNQHIDISDQALKATFRLLQRYFPYEGFPGKGIRFLGQCINQAQIESRTAISRQHVLQHFIQQTGMPELFLRDDLPLDAAELELFFQQRIIGQPAAVNKLCQTVKVFKSGLNDPGRPINTLLFAGPTGVGKTASAKALADYFFGKGQRKSPLIRIDMSEFQHPGMISRLIGSGKEPGQLVREVRERPFSVLLLDEIEKADKSIFDALLTILDEGLLVDSFGRVTNFRNTIIIMTSNLGASSRSAIGFQETTDARRQYESAILRHFRPEFVNRIDSIVHFQALQPADIRKITRKELQELSQREGFLKKDIQVTFTDRLVDHLTLIGFDERYGARPLQRAVEQSVVTPMAHWLLENQKVRQATLEVDYQDGLIIRKI